MAGRSQAAEDKWLSDLAVLFKDAKSLFADICWVGNDGMSTVYAHKAIIYSRCSGSFQHRYLVAPLSVPNDSTLSLPFVERSQRSVTPNSGLRDIPDNGSTQLPRSVSPNSFQTVSPSSLVPLPLGDTDISVFRACLEHFYSGSNNGESFAVLFEGFEEGVREGEPELKGVQKLRQDMLYTWRSKLYADMTISIDNNQGTVFATHRAILAARSPYFRTLLRGDFNDSQRSHFTLPSPPFTTSSTTFVLGYCYTGTLDFGNRTFDLTTAFEIWRAAAYLSLSFLQEEVETKIEQMLNLARAPRIYAFALASDVNSQRLARAASPLVVNQFAETWNAPHIGNLEYTAQRKLVAAVCETISPLTVASIGKGSFTLRKKLELDRASWAEHVRAMLDAIDDRIKTQLAKNLAEVVVSPGFVGLVDGQGFSTDVLEWLVSELVVSSLTEAKAPDTYQCLVGLVLLREEGILMDAKVIVEDAKNGVFNYIKRRLMSIVAAKGFDQLESWCIKELSDELEVPIEDLLTPLPKSSGGPARLTARAPPKPSTLLQSKRATATSTTPTSRPITPSAPGSASHRIPRLSAVSSIVSTTARPAVPIGTTAASATPRGAPSSRGRVVVASTRVGAAPSRPTTQSDASVSAPPPALLSAPLSASLPSKPVVGGSSTNPSSALPPKPSRAVPPPPTSSTTPGSSALLSNADVTTPARPLPNGTTPRPRPSPSITRRPPSLAPSERSITSTSTAFKAKRAVTSSKTPIPPPRAPAQPSIPSRGSTPATPAIGTTSGKTNGTLAAPPVKVLKRPSSIASTKSTVDRTRRPSSAASTRSVTSIRANPPVILKKHPSAGSLTTASPNLGTRTPKGNNAPPTPRIPLAEKVALVSHPPPKPTQNGLPGTTLLSGIPCIVTVAAEKDKSMRFRASVRYLGGVLWAPGQWVGIEVAESAIPDEARDLAWNQGDVDGQRYFDIKVIDNAGNSGRGTPLVTEIPDGRSAGSSGASSLRPPSRRQRRSSSTDAGESGPRRGLFVRPTQIVYVL